MRGRWSLGGGTDTGVYNVALGATLDFTGGTRNLNANSNITGLGSFVTSGATVNINNLLDIGVTGTVNLSGGVLNINSAPTIGTLNFSGGELGGTGALTITGPFNITGNSTLSHRHRPADHERHHHGEYARLGQRRRVPQEKLDEYRHPDRWRRRCHLLLGRHPDQRQRWNAEPEQHLWHPASSPCGTNMVTNNGTLHQTATGTHSIDGGLPFNNTGTITAEPGTLSLGGALATNTTNISIGGTTPETEYGRISTTGAATLSGTLNVSLVNGFTPSIGDSFTIMNYGSHTGTFATTNLPALTGGKAWNPVAYGANSMTLSVGSGVFTVTATAGANGSITPSGATSVNSGSDQGYTITPNTGYHVADVLVDSVSVGAVTSYTFSNVTTNHTIAASFAINSYTVSFNSNGGSGHR